jgi:hypothetical protein
VFIGFSRPNKGAAGNSHRAGQLDLVGIMNVIIAFLSQAPVAVPELGR